MALNLNELQQRVDRAIHNADEFVRKWIEFLSAPAGNVTLEYYDRNGNLRTVSFSNRNKLVQDFIQNVNAVMDKAFYVDAVNGSDTNDGTETSPFATIEKTITSAPPSSEVFVVLRSDITWASTVLKNKVNVIIVGDTAFLGRRPVIKTTLSELVKGEGIRLHFNDVDIVFDRTQVGVTNREFLFAHGTYRYRGDNYITYFSLFSCDITINHATDRAVILSPPTVAASIVKVNVTFNNTGTGLIYLCSAKSTRYLSIDPSTVTLTENGTAVALKTRIADVIKDANGIPRNIVTDLIL